MWYRYAGKKEVLEILNNDEKAYQAIKNLNLDPKFETSATYLYSKGFLELAELFRQLKVVDQRKPVAINASKNGIQFNGKKFTDYIPFTEEIHGLYNLISDKPRKSDYLAPESEKGKIQIFKANNGQDAIKYGSGTSWCISQIPNPMYYSYRSQQSSTFYFVFDGTRESNDPLSRVVVDINNQGISLTDLNNTTGYIQEFGQNPKKYMEYLQNNGVDTNQFKINPLTDEEKEEEHILRLRIIKLKDFIQLPYDYKLKYIARGHLLTNDQLKYLVENNANELIDIYSDIGANMPPSQISMLKPNQVKSYDRKQDIVLKNLIDQYDRTELLYRAAFELNYKLMDYLLDQGTDADEIAKEIKEANSTRFSDFEFEEALLWLFHHKNGCHASVIVNSFNHKTPDLLKYFVENSKGEQDRISTAHYAVRSLDYTDIDNIKWMVERGADGENALRRILTRDIVTNDFDLIKWFYNHDTSPTFLILHTKSPEIWKWIINQEEDPGLCNIMMDAMYQNGNKDYNLFLWAVENGGDINQRLHDWYGDKERNISLIQHGASIVLMWGYCVQSLGNYIKPDDSIEFFEWMLQNHNAPYYLDIALKHTKDLEIIKILLDNGADLKVASEYAYSVKIAKYLLERGADIKHMGQRSGERVNIMKGLGYKYNMGFWEDEQGPGRYFDIHDQTFYDSVV